MSYAISHDSHIESKTSWFIASHDAYRTFVIAYMTRVAKVAAVNSYLGTVTAFFNGLKCDLPMTKL